MKKTKILMLGIMAALFVLYACSSDDDQVFDEDPGTGIVDNPLEENYVVPTYSVLQLGVESVSDNPVFEWKLNGEVVSNDSYFNFISADAGTYEVALQIETEGVEEVFSSTVKVTEPDENYSKHISKVLAFDPAPGQFINDIPKYEEGDTYETTLAKVDETISNGENGMVSLGTFGGSITFQFDHTIINGTGADFKILGNAFVSDTGDDENQGNVEPGVIMVAWDKNGNGVPDEDEWYEIAGSEYHKESTLHNYSVTYYRPDENKEPVPGEDGFITDKEYIKWEDSEGNEGYLSKNSFHQQPYFPQWTNEGSITVTGTKMADNYVDLNGDGSNWAGNMFDYGYADNAPNDDDRSDIDIDWAVDQEGNPVKLPGIDFVKVYTGTFQEAGWLGEVSTEVTGAYDLRME